MRRSRRARRRCRSEGAGQTPFPPCGGRPGWGVMPGSPATDRALASARMVPPPPIQLRLGSLALAKPAHPSPARGEGWSYGRKLANAASNIPLPLDGGGTGWGCGSRCVLEARAECDTRNYHDHIVDVVDDAEDEVRNDDAGCCQSSNEAQAMRGRHQTLMQSHDKQSSDAERQSVGRDILKNISRRRRPRPWWHQRANGDGQNDEVGDQPNVQEDAEEQQHDRERSRVTGYDRLLFRRGRHFHIALPLPGSPSPSHIALTFSTTA